MNNYSIYLETESEKYDLIAKAHLAGATITGVSGWHRTACYTEE